MKTFCLTVAFSILAASVVMAQPAGEVPPAPPLPGAAALEPAAPVEDELTPIPAVTAEDELAPAPTDKYEPGGKCEGKGKGKCGGKGCGCGCGDWLSLLVPSDHCFDEFISPMTNPMNFEDPRTLTEARFIYMSHRMPIALGGSGIQVYSLQARAAVTDRLSIIATKDGMVVSQNPIVDDGWTDIAAGVKYNLYKDPCEQRLLSAGLTYEIPCGAHRALQGGGEGEFNVFLSGGAEVFGGHWLSGLGYRFPASDEESSMMYWSNHFDRELGDSGIYGLVEVNWYNWTKSGTNPALPGIEGLDLINLGSVGVAGNDIVTGAFGVKYKPNCHAELGVAWEFPLTDRRDILDNRLTADIILRY